MTQAIIAPVNTRRTPRSERAERSEQAARPAPAQREQQAEGSTAVPTLDRDPIVVPTPVFVGGRARACLVRVSSGLVGLALVAWLALAGSAVVGDHSAPQLRISADDAVDTEPLAPNGAVAAATASGGSTLFFPFERLSPSAGDRTDADGASDGAEPADVAFAADGDRDTDSEETATGSPTSPAGAAR